MTGEQKLRQLVGEIRKGKQPALVHEAWELARRLLARMPADAAEVERVYAAKDIDGLDALVTKLEHPAALSAAAGPLDPEFEKQMESALRAFRKRLKLTRLSDESRLGSRQLTGGKHSEIDAIVPPTEFPAKIWIALAEAGKLIHAGNGLYALKP
jgi:hypothetical protein